MFRHFRPGDPVVYHKRKFSTHPGPHAVEINPTPNGDDYTYCVDKFWRVVEVLTSGEIVVCTRRGKRHRLPSNDPALRPASWWERLFLSGRFPPLPSNPNLSSPGGLSTS